MTTGRRRRAGAHSVDPFVPLVAVAVAAAALVVGLLDTMTGRG